MYDDPQPCADQVPGLDQLQLAPRAGTLADTLRAWLRY